METESASFERESRQILRQVQDHLMDIHLKMGAVQESIGMVEVFHHPESAIPTLNYVTPRKNTAWVSSNYVRQGVEALQKHSRIPRIQYVEGLYPPQFAGVMRELGMAVERETPIMVYKPDGIRGRIPSPIYERPLPDGISVRRVNDQTGIGHWWYVWKNSHYDVLTLGVEPLFVGRDMEAVWVGRQLDYVLYKAALPVGVARVSLYKETAHLLALALLKEIREPAMIQILQTVAVKGALENGAKLVFAPGDNEAERRMARELGFMDFGSIVCYSAAEEAARGKHAHSVELSVLAF